MKTVRLENNVVREIIPNYALPVAAWYGEAFAAQCVEAPDEVEQRWVCHPEAGTFSPPTPEAEPEPSEAERLRADIDFLAAMQGVNL